MDKVKIDLDNNLIIRSENIEHEDDSLKIILDTIIESGTNKNGSYIKYSNGIQMCWKQVKANVQINISFGNLYETANTISFGDYASPFVNNPLIFGYCSDRTALLEGIQGYSTTSFGGTWLMRPQADSSANEYVINLIAIGRWK